jgi:(R,R)-butanediol dehydrogenase/meso-butanediol dehydrogenase/diacetyl reductase
MAAATMRAAVYHGAEDVRIDLLTTVAHVCQQDLPEALTLLAGRGVAGHLLDRVISLDALVTDGLDALVAHRATGKILVDPKA